MLTEEVVEVGSVNDFKRRLDNAWLTVFEEDSVRTVELVRWLKWEHLCNFSHFAKTEEGSPPSYCRITVRFKVFLVHEPGRSGISLHCPESGTVIGTGSGHKLDAFGPLPVCLLACCSLSVSLTLEGS